MQPSDRGIETEHFPPLQQNTGKETLMSRDDSAFEKILSALPVRTYRAGETIRSDGSKTGRLHILKSGEVEVLKTSAVLAANVTLLEKEPVVLLAVARILARRFVIAHESLVALKNAGSSPSAVRNVIAKMETQMLAHQILIPF